MSTRTLTLTDDLQAYLQAVSLREPPLLRRLREETAKLPMARMQIAPEQGQLMSLLARLTGVRKAIELGVFTGYSSLCVALAMPQDGRLVACDVNEEWTGIARRYWAEAGVAKRVELRLAPALETLDELLRRGEAGTFDFAFVDADKENYGRYYERVLELLRPGGLALFDNMLWGGRVIDPSANDEDTEAIRALNRRIHEDPRVLPSLIPIGDGLAVALKLGRAKS